MLSTYSLISLSLPSLDDPDRSDVVSVASGIPSHAVYEFVSLVGAKLVDLRCDPSGLTYNVSDSVTCGPVSVVESALWHAERIAAVLRDRRVAA
jgi:hypothetical protein